MDALTACMVPIAAGLLLSARWVTFSGALAIVITAGVGRCFLRSLDPQLSYAAVQPSVTPHWA